MKLRTGALASFLALSGCATRYTYSFAFAGAAGSDANASTTIDDQDVRAQVRVEANAVLFELTNKTDSLVQVQWDQIDVSGDGPGTPLRPDGDVHWISPGTTEKARLVPFVLPTRGHAAATANGRHYALEVPVIIRYEPRVLRFTFTANVKRA